MNNIDLNLDKLIEINNLRKFILGHNYIHEKTDEKSFISKDLYLVKVTELKELQSAYPKEAKLAKYSAEISHLDFKTGKIDRHTDKGNEFALEFLNECTYINAI